jgi:GT2 family glycosyltransferase
MAHPQALSVVVPTHETRELTLRCLAALAAADPPPAEVLVVDDGSSDGTADAVAASYPAARVLRHPQARGFTAAANAGLALAGGEVLLLLNSDTEVAPDAPGELAAALHARVDLGIAGASLFYPDGSPQWSGGDAPGPLWLFGVASDLPRRLGRLAAWRRVRPVSGHRPRSVDWVTGAAMAIRRVAWEAAGPLDPRFAFYGQDLDFCLRAAAAGWRSAVVPTARVMHHHGATVDAAGRLSPSRHDPRLLWADLVRWEGKRNGPTGAWRAARLLRLGGLVQRALLLPAAALPTENARTARRALVSLAAAGRAARDAARETPPRRTSEDT